MYRVLSKMADSQGVVHYAAQGSDSEVELVTEDELKLLVEMGYELEDSFGNRITMTGDTLNAEVEWFSDSNESDDDAEYNEFSDPEDEYGDPEDEYGDPENEDYEDEFSDPEDEEFDEFGDPEDEYGDSEYEEFNEFDDPEDKEDAEGSVVSKLYEMLTDEQITVLRRYYLWYSQRLFESSGRSTSFGIASPKIYEKKKESLDALRGTGDWRYAGFLDVGSKKRGYTCSLGHHPLRYMHLAWDITKGDIEEAFFGEDYNVDYERVIVSNGCIIFGIKCIGDFFSVDKECLAALKRTQSSSLRDMSILYTIYSECDVQAVKDSFIPTDTVVNRLVRIGVMRKDNPPVPLNILSMYKQFRDVDLVPPKSLLQEIRSCFVGWTDGKSYFSNKWAKELRYPKETLYSTLAAMLGSKYEGVLKELTLIDRYVQNFLSLVGIYIYTFCTYDICGHYAYNADNNKDEGGCSKLVKRALHDYYVNNTSRLLSDYKPDWGYLKNLLDICVIMNKLFAERKFVLESKGGKPVTCNAVDYYDRTAKRKVQEFDEKTGEDLTGLLSDAYSLRHATSARTFKRLGIIPEGSDLIDVAGLHAAITARLAELDSVWEKFLAYVEECNAEELTEGYTTPSSVVGYLLNQDLSGYAESDKFPLQVLNTLRESGKNPSPKQFKFIKPLFEKVSGQKYTGTDGRVSLESRQDFVEAVDWVLSNKEYALELASRSGVSEAQKALSIAESVKKYGTISFFQMPYIESVLKIYNHQSR